MFAQDSRVRDFSGVVYMLVPTTKLDSEFLGGHRHRDVSLVQHCPYWGSTARGAPGDVQTWLQRAENAYQIQVSPCEASNPTDRW